MTPLLLRLVTTAAGVVGLGTHGLSAVRLLVSTLLVATLLVAPLLVTALLVVTLLEAALAAARVIGVRLLRLLVPASVTSRLGGAQARANGVRFEICALLLENPCNKVMGLRVMDDRENR